MAMNSPSYIRATSGSEHHRIVSLQTAAIRSKSLPELSIFPAFTPDPIRLAELRGASTYSPPVSPTRGEAQELFVAIGRGQAFFELLDARGLTLDPIDETLDEEKTSDRINAVHCVDGRRKTLLHQACRCGNVQVAQSLLFHGADASARCRDGRTPFHEAVLSKGAAALMLLKLLDEHDPMGISIVDANGSHVLHLAAIHGDLSVIQWCAGLTQPSGKISGVTRKTSPVVHLGITTVSGRNMLHYATYNSRLDVLKWLLGPDNPRREELSLGAVDTNGYSVWHYAAMGASLQVCEWLVLEAPGRYQLNIMGQTKEGKTAVELGSARPSHIRQFLEEISKVPSVPSALRCLGVDTASLGVGWDLEPASNDARLWETLKPLYFQLEICKKPASLSRASGFLTMLMLMPQTTPGSPRAPPPMSSALMSASYLLHREPLDELLQPEAREHWLCGLEKDTEYLVRMRVRNRNGFSGYSVPSLSGAFTTSDGGRRRSLSSLQRFFGAIKEDPPVEAIALSFIGNLHFELLEARGLPLPANSLSQMTPPVRFFAVVTIETPSTPDVECSENSCSSTRVIYCVRSRLAALQQDLELSGSSKVWCHPHFSLSTVFRAPESLAHTQVTITVNHESQGQSDSCCMGRVTMRLLDLVQGMPAKLQWLPLINVQDSELDGGLILLRTLFLPNGVSELPHPTIPDTWGRTAEELLSTSLPPAPRKSEDWGPPPGSASSTSSSSSCSSQFAHSSMLVDRLGFVVFDPEMQLQNGEWQRNKPARSYAYYKLLIEVLERQQEKRWLDSRTLDRSEIRALIWQGIPMSRRPEMYSQMSGASSKRTRYAPGYFLLLIRRLEDPTDEVHSRPKNSRFTAAKKQIQVDLKRTFAGNDECWLNSATGQNSLERVLLAYALHNDVLGYCQSMTFVVGRLLCLFQSQSLKSLIEVEEQVFWLLDIICEGIFPSYYTQGMTGLQVDGGVLDRLVRMRLPKLHRHFQQLHVPPIGIVLVTQWLLPLCCTVFPSETTFRFLDVLFFEGSTVVFAMAIALLRVSQYQLLAESVDYTQLFRFLRARDQRLHDAPLLMEVAYDEHQVLADQINSLRDNVASELGIEAAKTASTSKLLSLPVDELRPGDVM